MPDTFIYNVRLTVRLDGPDPDWQVVANTLADRVLGMPIRGGSQVVVAVVDRALNPEAETF